MSDPYEDLKTLASEHGIVPAFRVDRGEPGKYTVTHVRLYDDTRPGFARLVLDDSPDPDESQQFLIETERLSALVHELRQPPPGQG
jgi:hypothetical protein